MLFVTISLFYCFFGFVSGVSLRLNGASNAVLDQTYTLYCIVFPLTDISTFMTFSRMRGPSSTWSRCSVNSECRERFPASGYSCGCYISSGGPRVYNPSVHLTDEANWRCEHSSDLSNSFNLTVFSPVTSVDIEVSGSFISPVTVVEGTQTVFTCFIQGAKPAPTSSQVSWYRQDTSGNNLSLPGLPGIPYTTDRNMSLTLAYNASRKHKGQKVLCAARNSLMVEQGKPEVASSNKIDINVLYPPTGAPVISGTTFPAYEGDTVTLLCTTIGGNPKPDLSLSCPGVSVFPFCSDSAETRICSASFTANRMQNNKNCVCTSVWAYNGYSVRDSRRMIIYYPPDIPHVSSDPHQPWAEHNLGTLNCSIPFGSEGNPPATFYWMRNGSDISQTGSTYTFTAAAGDNGVQYTCSAGNLFTDRPGRSRRESSSFQLDVHYAPRVKISPGNHTRVELGKLVILNCSADSNPPNCSFVWTLGTRHLGDGSEFQIAAFHESDQGKYKCSATAVSQSHGFLTGSANVVVTVLEPAPTSCFCTDRSGTSLELVWEYERSDKSTGFTIAQRLSKDTNWISISVLNVQKDDNTYYLHISDLKSNSSYYFKIFSSINKGDSNFCLTSCRTLILPREAASTDGLGLGSGIAIGLVIGIVVSSVVAVVIHIVLMRKGCLIRSDVKRPKETDIYQDISMETVQQDSPSTDASRMPNEPTSGYDSLQSREPTHYEQLHTYNNPASQSEPSYVDIIG